MRIKTIIIILITFLLTVIIMQNTGKVWFTILFMDVQVSKLIVLLSVAVIAFILGWLFGRPKKSIRLGNHTHDSGGEPGHSNTLSDEDNEYIN